MSNLKLGFAKVDFTPDGPVWLNRSNYATIIKEPLYANCIAWQEGDLTVLQFSLDLRNIYDKFYNMVWDAVQKATGLPKKQIIIAVSHNHSAPDIALFDKEENAEWIEKIGIPKICEAGCAALEDLTEVTGAVKGRAITEKVAFVRRYFREDGSLADVVSPPTESPLVAHETMADPELRVVRFDRKDKKGVLLVNFQSHAAHEQAIHRDYIGSDFVEYMRRTVEEKEDLLTFYCQGACGNVNTFTCLEEEMKGWPEEHWLVGELVGESVLEALENATPLTLGQLKLYSGELECHVNHSKTHLAEIAQKIKDETDGKKRFEMLTEAGISNLYEVTAILNRATFPKKRMMPLSSLVCGEFAQGFAPVELFDTCGKQFRDASPYDMTFFCGYALGSHNYMPSAIAFQNEGYEVLQCHYVPGTGEMIALELGRQINELKKK